MRVPRFRANRWSGSGQRVIGRMGSAVLVGSVAMASCGTRVDHAAVPTRSANGSPALGTTAEVPSPERLAVPGPTVSAVSRPREKETAGPATDTRPAKGAAQVANDAVTLNDTHSVSPSSGPAGAPALPGGQQAGSSPVSPSSRGSVVILASVGSYSGVPGTVFVPLLRGAQLWARYVNEQGGLNGHPVKLLPFDDGGDPARHRALVQEAVERYKAIAFLINGDPLTGQAGAGYITEKRIPVIGVVGGSDWASGSPMYFPQMANAEQWGKTMVPTIAARAIPAGKKKLGTLSCVDAPACSTQDGYIAKYAKEHGFDHVYRGRASIAQPDFTAECLAARNAGVEVFYVMEDQSSIGRVATACSRQGFRPVYAIISPTVVDQQKDDPNLDGMLAASNVFPYFQTGTPATDEYQRALRGYATGLDPGQSVAIGWAAGKLLEKAAAELPEPPTSEGIVAGLWTLKNETLGGLTPPLTFIENQPAVSPACWFNIEVKKRAWISSDGFQLHCV